jgi:hypothetical protein
MKALSLKVIKQTSYNSICLLFKLLMFLLCE